MQEFCKTRRNLQAWQLCFPSINPSFIIQGGDPTGISRGGEGIYGENFDNN